MIKLLHYYHNFIIHLIYAYFTRYTIKSFLLIARLTLSSQKRRNTEIFVPRGDCHVFRSAARTNIYKLIVEKLMRWTRVRGPKTIAQLHDRSYTNKYVRN